MHRTQTLCPGTQYMPYIYLRRNIMINTAHHNLYKTRLTDQVHAEVKHDEEGSLKMASKRVDAKVSWLVQSMVKNKVISSMPPILYEWFEEKYARTLVYGCL